MLTNDQRIELLLKARGYLVLAPIGNVAVGKEIGRIGAFDHKNPSGELSTPFVVLSETDKADAQAQQNLLAEHGEWSGDVADIPYYRVGPKPAHV